MELNAPIGRFPPFRPIKRRVLRRLYAFELDFNQIELSRQHLSFLLIPSSSSLNSASTEGLKSRFGGELKEKSQLESTDRVLRVLRD